MFFNIYRSIRPSVCQKMVRQIEICIFLAFLRAYEIRTLIQIREIGIRLIASVDSRHVDGLRVREKLPVDALPADTEDLLSSAIPMKIRHQLPDVMNNDCPVRPESLIPGEDNICAVLQRSSARKALKCTPSHHNHMVHRLFAEKFHIFRYRYKQFVAIADPPV